MPGALAFWLGVLGLPSFLFILTYYKNKCCVECDYVLQQSPVNKNAMANILPTEKKVLAVSMLAEGSSIRSIERVTGVHRDTIMRLGVRVGQACAKLHDAKMQNLDCVNLQVDEIWGFVSKKKKNTREFEQMYQGFGDVWTYIALDADSKLIPSFYTSSIRGVNATRAFIDDLAPRLRKHVQLSSDALASYADAVKISFGPEIDYAQVVKTYSVSHLQKDAASRYSPADVVKVENKVISGSPDKELISTSHIEKQNHTLRMHCRRLTRLTNGFSKKFVNFEAAVALNFVYYNFCLRHITVKTTPAKAAGVEDHEWTVAELVERCGE